MGTLAEIGRRFRALVQRARIERGLQEEMRLHLDLRQQQLQAAGLPARDARVAARRRFGNLLRLREDSINAWGWLWLEQLVQDVRFAARTLLKNPGFSATALLTLALATGATTSIFSIVNSVVLRPLPFADPDRLVQVYGRSWREDRGGPPDPVIGPVGSLELDAFATQSTTFDGFTGYEVTTRHLDGPAGRERLTAVEADRGFFTLLGTAAMAGRTFRADDPPDVAVISGNLWERRFDRDPSLPGRTIVLEGRAFTVLGVMPDAFQFPYGASSIMPGALPESRTDVWIPLEPVRAWSTGTLRRGRISVTARLKPAASIEEAAAELRVIAARVQEQYQGTAVRVGVRLEPLAHVVIAPVRRSLWMLFAAVGLVLAAACANVANLLLARMAARTREVVTRAALGAGRLRLVRQFLAESLLLSLGGGLLGIAVARWSTDLLVAVGSAKIPRAHEIVLDWRAFAFLLIACLTTAVLFGLAPALTAARLDVHDVAKGSDGQAMLGRNYRRIRDGLVVVEVSLAFVLALGAASVVREVMHLRKVPTGMVTENVLTLHLTPRAPAQDYYAIEQRVAQLPGVEAAGFTQLLPLQNWGWEADFSIRGPVHAGEAGRKIAGLRYVTPGYFRALGIPVVRGRAVTDGDTAAAPRVILINEALAHRYFPGEDPVGAQTDRGTIVGVVGNVRNAGLDRPTDPEIYYPAAQNVTSASDLGMSLVVRTREGLPWQTDRIRAAVRDVNPNLAIFRVKTMEQVRDDSLWELNLYRWLIGLFAALALVLAAIGLYGVLSYHVTSRQREFAVRMALGAEPIALAKLVLRRAVRLTGAGLAGGLLAALALVPWLQDLPIGAQSMAPTSAAVAALLVAIAVLACIVPMMRIISVNPANALRHD